MISINCRGTIKSWHRPVVMGILNLTPDSFFAESRVTMEEVVEKARYMVMEGAEILDIGGQSTRPGSSVLSAEEEAARVIPAIQALYKALPDVPVSIDTYHALVARKACEAGASIVNDISGGTTDPLMLSTVAKSGAVYICMHMQGNQTDMQDDPVYEDVTREVLDYFIGRMAACKEAGIKDIILDPGFGFGKTVAHNYTLLEHLDVFGILGVPLLAGVSRKSMINRVLHVPASEALNGTTVVNTIALLKGASILRVHDVREAKECIEIVQALPGRRV